METSTSRTPAPRFGLLAVRAADGRLLAPCSAARARQLIRAGKARLVWRDGTPGLRLLGAGELAQAVRALEAALT